MPVYGRPGLEVRGGDREALAAAGGAGGAELQPEHDARPGGHGAVGRGGAHAARVDAREIP